MAVMIENPRLTHQDSLIESPCGCYECTHGVQPGHEHTCEAPSKWLLLAEAKGQVYRRFDKVRKIWNWYRCNRI